MRIPTTNYCWWMSLIYLFAVSWEYNIVNQMFHDDLHAMYMYPKQRERACQCLSSYLGPCQIKVSWLCLLVFVCFAQPIIWEIVLYWQRQMGDAKLAHAHARLCTCTSDGVYLLWVSPTTQKRLCVVFGINIPGAAGTNRSDIVHQTCGDAFRGTPGYLIQWLMPGPVRMEQDGASASCLCIWKYQKQKNLPTTNPPE